MTNEVLLKVSGKAMRRFCTRLGKHPHTDYQLGWEKENTCNFLTSTTFGCILILQPFLKLGDFMADYFKINCQKCNKFLGKSKGDTEIICPCCGGINRLTFKTKEIKYISRLQKSIERTSSSGKRFS